VGEQHEYHEMLLDYSSLSVNIHTSSAPPFYLLFLSLVIAEMMICFEETNN
jgi:hypothetical protein